MNNQALERPTCILHLEIAHWSRQVAAIPDLSTALSIERRGIQDHQRRLWCADTVYLFTIYYEADDLSASSHALIAKKLCGTDALQNVGEGAIIGGLDKGAGRAATLLLA